MIPVRSARVAFIILLSAFGVAGGQALASCPDFRLVKLAETYPLPTHGIAIADFNGDAKEDLAVSTGNGVSILLGNGDGTFSPGNTYEVCCTSEIASGDFNGDGKVDLVVTESNAIAMLPGDGNGAFGSPLITSVGAQPADLAVGDFNGDGKSDVAIANASNSVSVFFGTSSALAFNGTYSIGTNANSIVAADVNADGKLDLATANGKAGYDFDGTVSVLLGQANGAFVQGGDYPAGVVPYSVASGDFNGDGTTDLAVTNEGYGSGMSYVMAVAILPGTGDGRFGPLVRTNVDYPMDIAVADFNGDGKTDLAVSSLNTIVILLGNGDFTFTTVKTGLGASAWAIAVSDFNGDSQPDVAAGGNDLKILMGNGEGTFAHYGPAADAISVTSADFNNDGRQDIAALFRGAPGSFAIALGNGDGSVSEPFMVPAGQAPRSFVASDFNGDGNVDIVVANSNLSYVALFLGNGDGTFMSPSSVLTSSGVISVVTGDFNRDGNSDLAALQSRHAVLILLGRGDGTFYPPVAYGDCDATFSAVGDFNGDGALDVAVYSENCGVGIMLGHGDGTFSAPTFMGADVGGERPVGLAAGDFNRDGRSDLVLSAAFGSQSTITTSIRTGKTDGTFGPPVVAGAGIRPITADFNGDGAADLAYTYHDANLIEKVFVLLGNGDGTVQPQVAFDTSGDPVALAPADLNGDGKIDLVAMNAGSASPAVLLNACGPPNLTVSKSHIGNFTQGDNGVTYTIAVTNSGDTATAGPVSVVDALPSGLTATAISGPGWNCDLAPLTCTRSDALGAGSSYSPITLTVNVAGNAPASITNSVTVSGGSDLDGSDNVANDPTTINVSVGLIAPTPLEATAITVTEIGLTWNGVTGATGYDIYRRGSDLPLWMLVGTSTTSSFIDSGVAPNNQYAYEVRATDALHNFGPMSNADFASTFTFADDPLAAGSSLVLAIHVEELRNAVNAARALAGLAPATFTDAAPPGALVKAVHITELRMYLEAARAALGLPAKGYTDSALSIGTTIKAIHLQELRSALK